MLPLTITNKSGIPAAFAAIIGLDANGLWAYVNADGSLTEFTPAGPNNYLLSFTDKLDVGVPALVSGQVYLSVGNPLVIGVNPDPQQPGGLGLVLPAGWASGDPNYGTQYDVVEFTLNDAGLNCDTTQVDAFGLPLSLELVGASIQESGGWDRSMAEIFSDFLAHPLLGPLVVNVGGVNCRILNPSHGIDTGVFPADYLDSVIGACWNGYISTPLEISLAGAFAGNYLGSVASMGAPMTITLDGVVVGEINYPTTRQALACNGPFDQGNTAMGAVANVVATAINRGILDITPQPDCNPHDFYPDIVAHNTYAKILHILAREHLCYAFAYDDQCNQSSDISDPSPTKWEIEIGCVLDPA